jgi:hypothetical protein
MAIQFTNYQLFIDPVEQICYKGFQNLTAISGMTFTQGDDARVEVYVVGSSGIPGSPMQVFPFPSGTVSVEIGNPGSAKIIGTTSSTAVPTPAIAQGTAGGGVMPFTVGKGAYSGYFSIAISNGSPTLTATTRFIQFPLDTADMAQAIVDAVNAQSGWSEASCQVLQTGEYSGTVSLTAKNSTTVYTITGLTFTSSLTGLSGKYLDLDFGDAAIGTFLGSDTEKTTTLEVQITDTDVQTYIQLPITIRKQVLAS